MKYYYFRIQFRTHFRTQVLLLYGLLLLNARFQRFTFQVSRRAYSGNAFCIFRSSERVCWSALRHVIGFSTCILSTYSKQQKVTVSWNARHWRTILLQMPSVVGHKTWRKFSVSRHCSHVTAIRAEYVNYTTSLDIYIYSDHSRIKQNKLYSLTHSSKTYLQSTTINWSWL